jgi:hypothetical protein
MTHWLDFFGTMWGREYIGAICRGYRAVARGTENEFPKVILITPSGPQPATILCYR